MKQNVQKDTKIIKLEMYAMVSAIESDIIETYITRLCLNNIPNAITIKFKTDEFEDQLRELDLQSFIEIANSNVVKLGISKSEKDFFNNEFQKLIPIRNRVMHPRILEFYDYDILLRCFNSLESRLKFIKWHHVHETALLIEKDPSALFKFDFPLRKNERIIENIPDVVDFEETSFIGRVREMGEIKEKLYKKNVHILSIVGDGGVGKTAIVIKLLYDLLDDIKCPFELILWVSLKTNELNDYEFKNISKAINTTKLMYEKLSEFIGESDNLTTEEHLIRLSKEFSTLFILDNLETVNSEDVKVFLDKFSENGKIIITSRIGLGEMEHRYFLQGFLDKDMLEYFNTLLELYGLKNYLSDEEKLKLAKDKLYSNPLAVKWLVRGLNNGLLLEDLISNRENLINFCMSNVYLKLSEESKYVVSIIICALDDITLAELAYYIGEQSYDDAKIRGAINELIKCNFIDQCKFQSESLLSINQFAKEFLTLNVKKDNVILGDIKNKQKILNAFEQKTFETRGNKPHASNSFYFLHNEKNKIVAAYYLEKAVENFYKKDIEQSLYYVHIAKKLCCSYFECYLIEAKTIGNSNIEKIKELYKIALSYTQTDKEKLKIYMSYTEFCLFNNDYQGALDNIDKAILIDNSPLTVLEKVKILSCVRRLEEADELLEKVKPACITDTQLHNIFITRKADILRRKSEQIVQRDYLNKFKMLKESADIIKEYEHLDKYSLEYLARLLIDMMHMYYEKEVCEYVFSTLTTVDSLIFKTKNISQLKKSCREILNKIPIFENRDELIKMLTDLNEKAMLLEDKEALVYSIKGTYGFIKNKDYSNGIFFLLTDIKYNVSIGDIVCFNNIIDSPKGYVVKDFYKLKNICD